MNKSNLDSVISAGLLSLWGVLAIFAIYSAAEPDWLAETNFSEKKDEVADILRRGISHYAEGEDAESEAAFLEALEILPDLPEAEANLGLLYASQGRFDEAERRLKRALTLEGADSSGICDILVDLYIEKNNFVKAEYYFQKSIETNPSIIDRLMKAGNYYIIRARWEKALPPLERALDERFVMDNYFRDMALHSLRKYELNENQTAVAKRLLDKPLTMKYLSRFDKRLFEKLVNMDKGLAINHNKTGFALANLGHYRKSLLHFEKAVGIWGEYKDARENIHYVRTKLGE